jgi:hypothetical protein
MGVIDRLRSKFGLWRDRLLVNLLVRFPALAVRQTGGKVRDRVGHAASGRSLG